MYISIPIKNILVCPNLSDKLTSISFLTEIYSVKVLMYFLAK